MPPTTTIRSVITENVDSGEGKGQLEITQQARYASQHTSVTYLISTQSAELQQTLQRLQNDLQALASKITELEAEADEHE